jgi:hypothetical protein
VRVGEEILSSPLLDEGAGRVILSALDRTVAVARRGRVSSRATRTRGALSLGGSAPTRTGLAQTASAQVPIARDRQKAAEVL